jgi:hypothetical protein
VNVIPSSGRSGGRPLHVLVLAAVVAVAGACSDSGPTGPGGSAGGDLLLITSVVDQSGLDGSSFVQTIGLDRTNVNNSDAFEQPFRPYPTVHGNDVWMLQHLVGDQLVRYTRGSDGRLSEHGRMSLPPGSAGIGIVIVSPTKAYVSLMFAGKILIFNPQTMAATGEIDLTTLGIARNPSNAADNNPEPGVLVLRAGKLFVGLQQLVTGFASADGADLAVIDVATDTFEKVIHDPRTAGPGNYGFRNSMFVDEAGDLYVYCVASFGFAPGQKAGILRIPNGSTEFDPTFFISFEDAAVDVPGGRVSLLGGMVYGGNGYVYAGAAVPALESNPPDYARDRNFQPIRIHLASGQIEALPLPRSNGIASGVTLHEGRILFGLSTVSGVGIYSYDPATNQASGGPVVTTVGDPTHVVAM